jgi:hypothetical protein
MLGQQKKETCYTNENSACIQSCLYYLYVFVVRLLQKERTLTVFNLE